MFARGFRLFLGVAGAAVALPLVAFLLLTTHSQLTAAPHLLEAAVHATLSTVVRPYLLLSLLAAVSLALADVLKPTFCITATISIILMAALLITAYNRRDHLDIAACSVSCAHHVTNVSRITSLRHASGDASCWFIPRSRGYRFSRCYAHDPQLVMHFSNAHYLQLLDATYVLMLLIGLLVAFSAPSSTTTRKDMGAL